MAEKVVKKFSDLVEGQVADMGGTSLLMITDSNENSVSMTMAQLIEIVTATFPEPPVIPEIPDEFLKQYIYDKNSAVDIPSDSPVDLVSVSDVAIADGDYRYQMDYTYIYNSTTKSAQFEFSTDGGVTWVLFQGEGKDKTDHRPHSYGFTRAMVEGEALELKCRFAQETGGTDTLVMEFVDCSIERKL